MDLQLVHALDAAHVAQLCDFYANEWWSTGRARADVERMLAHSEVVALCAGDELLAFARAVTDYVYKALVLDVIVAPAHRGSGLGARILDALMQHPKLAEVRHFELYCAPDMTPFYERWGYTSDLGTLTFMRYSRSS